jgi:hypothetical protein
MKGIMRAIVLSTCLCLALAAPVSSASQSALAVSPQLNRIPPNILEGLDALRSGQLDEAERDWFKASLVQHGGIVDNLRNFREQEGDYHGFDLIALTDISPRIRVVYVSLNYERGPHFLKFVSYRNSNGWVLLLAPVEVTETGVETVVTGRPQS